MPPHWWYRLLAFMKYSRGCFGSRAAKTTRSGVVAAMQRGRLVDLDAETALDAARTAHESKLPMADAMILAMARASGATLWTQDSDFEGIAGVRFVRKEG